MGESKENRISHSIMVRPSSLGTMERDLNNNAARAAAHVLLLRILRVETARLRRSNGSTRLLFLR